MGWREDLWLDLEGAIADLEHNPTADDVVMATLRRVAAALHADMPASDRIALARELLRGTGRVVAREVGGKVITPDMGRPTRTALNRMDGWNACRAAMLKIDP